MSDKTADQIQAELREFFPQDVVGWKPQAISGNRAMAVAYIDARDVEDRLDAVVGCDNWRDEYRDRPDGNVVCTLSLRINGEWVGKTDVGGESDQKDDGDRCKAAFSDAFKRAAVKWGVGRYLYSLPKQWVDYDPQKKAFARDPQLPDWARPKGAASAPAVSKPATQQPAPKPAKKPAEKPTPRNGAELLALVKETDKKWAHAGKKTAGQLLRELTAWGEQQLPPFPQLVNNWNLQQTAAGCDWIKAEWARLFPEKAKQQGAA